MDNFAIERVRDYGAQIAFPGA